MPYLNVRDLGMQGKLVLAFVALAAGWLALQTGAIEALLALGVGSPTVLGLVVIGVLAWWAFDELEDDDDATDVISKTSGRAEDASRGFLNGTSALIMGIVAVGGTVGMEVFDGLLSFVDVALTVPMASAQIGTAVAGIAGAAGVLATNEVAIIAAALLVAAFVARRNGADT